jgi:hypothetical protein
MEVGNWYHWVFTYTGHQGGSSERYLRAYRNGEAVVLASDGTTGGAYVRHNRAWGGEGGDTPVYFGGRNRNDGTQDNWWATSLTDVAIFSGSKDTAVADYNAVDSDEAGPVPDWVTETYNNGTPTNLKGQDGLVGYWRYQSTRKSSSS